MNDILELLSRIYNSILEGNTDDIFVRRYIKGASFI